MMSKELDPRPYVKDLDGTPTRAGNDCGGWPVTFDPLPEFEQDQSKYPVLSGGGNNE